MAFNADVQKLEPGNLIRLFEVDATRLGGNLWRFHGHAQEGEIIWQGNVYEPIQITAKGFDIRGDGRPASPTLQLANELAGIRGAISAICLQLRDLCGARVRVIETWRHYLDSANFPDGNPDAADEARVGIWFIEQKTEETREQVTFALSSPIDMEGQMLPAQQITKLCRWACRGQYRGEACAYTGAALFTKKDEPTDNPALDRCGGRWSSCKLRGNTNRFGSVHLSPHGGSRGHTRNLRLVHGQQGPADPSPQGLPPMKTVRLYGALRREFGREYVLDVSGPREATIALASMVDGFEKFMRTAEERGMRFAVFVGRRNLREEELDLAGAGESVIRIVPVIQGSKSSGIFQTVLGAALVVAGYFTFGTTSAIGVAMMAGGAGLALGGVAQMLAPSTQASAAKNEDGNNPSYGFGGAMTTIAQGNPYPVLYGEREIGGAVESGGVYTEDQL